MIPSADFNNALSQGTQKRTVRKTFLLLKAVKQIIDDGGITIENNWKYYYANQIVIARHAASLADVLTNYPQVLMMEKQQNEIFKWSLKKNPNADYTNKKFLDEIINVLSTMDTIIIQLDRIILRIYNYNIRVASDKAREIEQFIEDELALLYGSLGIDNANVDQSELHRLLFSSKMHVRFGAENRIHCDPPTGAVPNKKDDEDEDADEGEVRHRVNCPPEQVPLLHNESIWKLVDCDEGTNKQYPALLLDAVRSMVDNVDKYRTNNYSDAQTFIDNIEGFKKLINNILDVFWNYLALPNVDEVLLRTEPELNSIYYTIIVKAYNHVLNTAKNHNAPLYNSFFSKYSRLAEFMEHYFVMYSDKRFLAFTFVDYACWKFAADLTAASGQTSGKSTNNGTVLYVNGQKVKRQNINISSHELDRFVRTIKQRKLLEEPNWIPANNKI